ncbi:MAG: SCO family protein [Polyangiaceae bacterium]
MIKAQAAERSALEARVSSLVARPVFWVVLLLAILSFPLSRAFLRPLPKPPSLRLPVPAFELVNQRGQKFGSADLAGKVYVVDFIYTSCGGPCPRMTKVMERIQKRTKNLGTAFQLVTITVDPENDTPEKLAEYTHGYHVNPTRWSFLTGTEADIQRIVVKGFKSAMSKEEAQVGHSERLLLVDGDGAIRGIYDSDDDDSIASLIRDADILLNLRDWGSQGRAAGATVLLTPPAETR